MKNLICFMALLLAMGCGENANGVDAAADTDMTDTGQPDVAEDVVEDASDVEQPVILLDFDLESVPAECLFSDERLYFADRRVIMTVEQLNTGPVPFAIDYAELVKEIERPGYATVFEKRPVLSLKIREPESVPVNILETLFVLYKEDEDGNLEEIDDDIIEATPDGRFLPPFDLFYGHDGFHQSKLLPAGKYALEAHTEGALQVIGDYLYATAYFVDLDCLD